jgi:MFS family permease
MYAAFALGAPAGTILYASFGFTAIALATTLVPLAALLLVAPLRRVAPTARVRPSFTKVVAAVWLPGLGLALTSAGFGAMTAFVALLFAARGWTVWPAFTTFAVAFIVARMLLGHLADRMGGAKVALTCLLIEAAGQALLWLAPSSLIALIGTALTGFGYSLVYPGFGVEAVRRAPAQSRGLAMGAYTAFLDVALALASPALGLIAAMSDIGTVFLASALSVLCAAPVAMRLLHAPLVKPLKGLR